MLETLKHQNKRGFTVKKKKFFLKEEKKIFFFCSHDIIYGRNSFLMTLTLDVGFWEKMFNNGT